MQVLKFYNEAQDNSSDAKTPNSFRNRGRMINELSPRQLRRKMSLGTGKKNCPKESAHLICILTADFPKHIYSLPDIATNNRTVNTTGKQGHGKPIDHRMEHYKL